MVKDLIGQPRGEYSVVADMGHITEISPSIRPREDVVLADFGEITKNGRVTRRAAVATLAKRYQLRPNQVYKLIESAKKSGK